MGHTSMFDICIEEDSTAGHILLLVIVGRLLRLGRQHCRAARSFQFWASPSQMKPAWQQMHDANGLTRLAHDCLAVVGIEEPFLNLSYELNQCTCVIACVQA